MVWCHVVDDLPKNKRPPNLKITKEIQDRNNIEKLVRGVIHIMSSRDLVMLGVKDQIVVSMDVDICSNIF